MGAPKVSLRPQRDAKIPQKRPKERPRDPKRLNGTPTDPQTIPPEAEKGPKGTPREPKSLPKETP